MRIVWYWLLWCIVAVFTLRMERSLWFFLLVLLLGLCFIPLIVATVLLLLGKGTHALREGFIRARDSVTESPLERSLAEQLDKLNVKYVREYKISRIHVDFAIPSAKIAVECDGYRYHRDHDRDAARDAFLKSQGWTVLRFTGTQIRADPQACARRIYEHL